MSWGDGDRSASRREFRAWFGSDEACLDYLEWLRSRQAPADARTHAKFGATSRESPVENGPRGTTPVKWIPQKSYYSWRTCFTREPSCLQPNKEFVNPGLFA